MRVIIESPFAGKTEEEAARNDEYLSAALAHSLGIGEAGFASHGLYTRKGVLDDTIPEERQKGIEAGFMWRDVAEKTAFYGDRGITPGMVMGLEHAVAIGCPITFRSLGEEWQIDHPHEPGEFKELAALSWLRKHSKAEWHDKNRYGWMNHMKMMFGGVDSDVFNWNIRKDDYERYIVHQGGEGYGFYMVDLHTVNERLGMITTGMAGMA